MNEVFSQYLQCFLHPWQTQETLRKMRQYNKDVEKIAPLELVEERAEKKLDSDFGITWNESLIVSWLFSLIQLFYILLGTHLGLEMFSSYSGQETSFSPFLLIATKERVIYMLLFQGVLFPVFFWITTTFWTLLINSSAKLFEKDDNRTQQVAEEIIATSLTSHTFLIIPILGPFFFKVTTLIYLFGGLKKNLEFSSLQSFLVILFPLIIFLLMSFLLFALVAIAFSGF
jgi:hypothetical protein